MPIRSSRRLGLACVGAMALAALAPMPALAQSKEAKIAVVVPLSGPWARNGELHLKGAELAAEQINAAGGIKALGGAKVKLIVGDAGDSTEKAKNAMQRIVSQNPDLVGGTGAFVSSFTLAVTEISERAEVPWLTLSYSDQITNRGYKYVFQTSPTASKQAADALPVVLEIAKRAGVAAPRTVGIVMDNTASPVSFTKSMREGGFAKEGLKLVVDETFTPPLADATSLVQKVRNARPDLLLLLTTNVPDTKLLLEKLNEMGLGKGRLPILTNGGHMGAPELLKVVGKDMLEGVMVAIANWGGKGQEDLIKAFRAKTGEPWMTQDSISTYGDVMLLADAMEQAKSADPKKVGAALHAMDSKTGAARFFPGQHLHFDAAGHREGAELVVLQWQNGEPVPVYPAALATAKAAWPRH
ncbi:MAG: ABC transporter substrate-binding protein [Burkholderiales bacterium]|nr:ABC transporter substrate-binding protein [Burkholderiales bacterium]